MLTVHPKTCACCCRRITLADRRAQAESARADYRDLFRRAKAAGQGRAEAEHRAREAVRISTAEMDPWSAESLADAALGMMLAEIAAAYPEG